MVTASRGPAMTQNWVQYFHATTYYLQHLLGVWFAQNRNGIPRHTHNYNGVKWDNIFPAVSTLSIKFDFEYRII